MKFRVRIVQTVIEEAWLEVEAPDRVQAETEAIERASRGKCHWRFLESCEAPYEVLEVIGPMDIEGRYVIWSSLYQGYRPRDYDAKHGGIFAAKRYATKEQAEASCWSKNDTVHVIGKDGIPTAAD